MGEEEVSETWEVFTVGELQSIAFECPNCHTVSAFPAAGDPAGRTERQCPGCNKPIPRAGGILHLYRSLQEHARAAADEEKVVITLRAKTKD